MAFKIWRQYIVPHHLLSRFMGWFTTRTWPWLKNWQIRTFIKKYSVDMSQAVYEKVEDYVNFTHFFTRHLKQGSRPIAGTESDIVSPVDGVIAQMGEVRGSRLIQAKHHDFDVGALLGGDPARARLFQNGSFATLYLAPADYHRIHMPLSGTLKEMVYVPGQLFSVNLHTASHVPNLFARNERVVCLFETEVGPMAMVLVGAMFVASICTSWAGVVAPDSGEAVVVNAYESHAPIRLSRGEEMGYFNFGSTVILLFGEHQTRWLEGVKTGDNLRMGQLIAKPSNNT